MLILAMDTLSDRVPRLSHRLRGTCLCNVTHVSWSESVRECVTQAVCVHVCVCCDPSRPCYAQPQPEIQGELAEFVFNSVY
jgi:hypothetical protein